MPPGIEGAQMISELHAAYGIVLQVGLLGVHDDARQTSGEQDMPLMRLQEIQPESGFPR